VRERTIRLSLDASPALHLVVAQLAEELDCTQAGVLRRAIRTLKAVVDARKAGRSFRPAGAKQTIMIW